MVVAFRYVGRELVLVFAVTFATLLVVALGGRFIGYLQDAALGRYSADALLTLISLRLPEFVQMTVPFAFFVAVLLTWGRLHAEREFAVLLGGGARPRRMLGWLGAVALPVGAVVGYLSLAVTPGAAKAFADLATAQRVSSEFEAITPGTFHDFDRARRVTYAREVSPDRQRLVDVFTDERQGGGGHVAVWAEAGSHYVAADTGSRFLVLENGTRYEGAPGLGGFRVVAFERLGQRVERNPITPTRIDPRTLPTTGLPRGGPEQVAELHWRLALPLVTVIGAFCAFGMARVRPRAGRFARIVPGVVLFSAYYLGCVALQSAIADGLVPPAVGLWPVHLLMALAAVALVRRAYRPL
ncbi:MAG: LPS export ABC transporter permease LptF [Gammaproteobacteria bacterium]|nr:LPS export ABC transporter permease LptF [Gammaproteobacteria bacterium]